MTRRSFLQAGAALSAATFVPTTFAQEKALRVGLIGTGWYGKCDLLRLIQVAPVDVVSLCDVDRRMLADAAALVAQRQKSGKQPRTYGDYRKMLAEKDLDVVVIGTPDHWHAEPVIAAPEAALLELVLQHPQATAILPLFDRLNLTGPVRLQAGAAAITARIGTPRGAVDFS